MHETSGTELTTVVSAPEPPGIVLATNILATRVADIWVGLAMRFWDGFGLLVCTALLLASGEARADKRVALVVGNDRYATLPADMQLQKAVNDAKAVGDQFARLGFTVVSGQNL